MTVESTVQAAEAAVIAEVTTVEAKASSIAAFWNSNKIYILPALSALIGLYIGHKL